MARFNITSSGKTDVGMRREQNEDSFTVEEDFQLYVVADGMGGHAAGEVASALAVKSIVEFITKYTGDIDITWPFGYISDLNHKQNLLSSAIRIGNLAIYEMSQEQSEMHNMGTTVVATMIDGEDLIIAHVGDSRVYRFRGDTMDQITVDHTWVNEQRQRNIITEEEAKNHRWKNVITRALGNRPEVEVDVQKVSIQDGDLYLICSDGLNTMLEDEEIRQKLLHSKGDLDQLNADLIQASNDKGGFDNITVVLMSFESPNNTPTLDLEE